LLCVFLTATPNQDLFYAVSYRKLHNSEIRLMFCHLSKFLLIADVMFHTVTNKISFQYQFWGWRGGGEAWNYEQIASI